MIENICFSAFQIGWWQHRMIWSLGSTFPSLPLAYKALHRICKCLRYTYLIYSQKKEFTEISSKKKKNEKKKIVKLAVRKQGPYPTAGQNHPYK